IFMASFIAPRIDEWEAMHPCGPAPLKHEIPPLAYSELYRHWFVTNLTFCSFLDKQVNFAHMIDPVATPLGFEPRITPPKGAVLPLHHGVNRLADLRFSTAQRKLQLAQRSS